MTWSKQVTEPAQLPGVGSGPHLIVGGRNTRRRGRSSWWPLYHLPQSNNIIRWLYVVCEKYFFPESSHLLLFLSCLHRCLYITTHPVSTLPQPHHSTGPWPQFNTALRGVIRCHRQHSQQVLESVSHLLLQPSYFCW